MHFVFFPELKKNIIFTKVFHTILIYMYYALNDSGIIDIYNYAVPFRKGRLYRHTSRHSQFLQFEDTDVRLKTREKYLKIQTA